MNNKQGIQLDNTLYSIRKKYEQWWLYFITNVFEYQ